MSCAGQEQLKKLLTYRLPPLNYAVQAVQKVAFLQLVHEFGHAREVF